MSGFNEISLIWISQAFMTKISNLTTRRKRTWTYTKQASSHIGRFQGSCWLFSVHRRRRRGKSAFCFNCFLRCCYYLPPSWFVSHTSKYSLDEKGKHKRGNNDMKQTEDGKRLRKIRQLLNDKLVEMWAKFFKTNKPWHTSLMCLNSVFASFFFVFQVTPPLFFGIWGNFLEIFKNFWKVSNVAHYNWTRLSRGSVTSLPLNVGSYF